MACGCTCNADLSNRGCVSHATATCPRPNRNIVDSFGDAGSDVIINIPPRVDEGNLIYSTDFQSMKDSINTERARRGYSDISVGAVAGELIEAVDYNALRGGLVTLPRTGSTSSICNSNNGLDSDDNGSIRPPSDPVGPCHTAGDAYVPTIATMSVGNIVTTTDYNELFKQTLLSSQSCFCDCNYCACNCNYCACNCNYGCTCECNYSDETLKENIEYL